VKIDATTTTILTFGKHKGQRVEEVETQYLRWALRDIGCDQLNEMSPGMGYAIHNELARREQAHTAECQRAAAERRKEARQAMAANGFTPRPGRRKPCLSLDDLEPSPN
jgi:hypothetical protein